MAFTAFDYRTDCLELGFDSLDYGLDSLEYGLGSFDDLDGPDGLEDHHGLDGLVVNLTMAMRSSTLSLTALTMAIAALMVLTFTMTLKT